ncbi:response regulator, partial [Escherichia coli]|uniref:response regulator n=1 Tax=Escherichia coli TaxID=562 RepID=UPI002115C20C
LLPRRDLPAGHIGKQGKAEMSNLLDGLKVLLVEDDADLNVLIGDMLEEHGSEVFRATSADEGLRLFEQNAIEAVLSDMVMPGGMDGLDL